MMALNFKIRLYSVGDGGYVLKVAEEECRDAISQMLDAASPSPPGQLSSQNLAPKIEPLMQYNGRAIYKATLVSELNGNPFLSKDRSTRIKNSVYFNNIEDYVSAANSATTAFLGLGTDCGVLFTESPTLGQSSGVRAVQKKRRCSAQVGRPTAVTTGPDVGTWWLGRVQKMRRRVGQMWGLCRNPVDLMAHTLVGKKVSSSPPIQVMLNWFKSAPGKNRYKYEVMDTQWIDIESVICTIALSFNLNCNVYTLREADQQVLDDFVSKKS